jgi:hypothetical protein
VPLPAIVRYLIHADEGFQHGDAPWGRQPIDIRVVIVAVSMR